MLKLWLYAIADMYELGGGHLKRLIRYIVGCPNKNTLKWYLPDMRIDRTRIISNMTPILTNTG